MAGGFIGANPNQAAAGGQRVQSAAAASEGVRGQFNNAASNAAVTAVEAPLPTGYQNYQAHFLDRINAVLNFANQAGINIQTGAAEVAATDNVTSTGFGTAQAAIPSLNRRVA